MYAPGKNFLCTHLVKTLNFYNMLLAAKYAPRKNLEKAHIRQIRTNKSGNVVQKLSIFANPGLFIVKYFFLRKPVQFRQNSVVKSAKNSSANSVL